MDGTNSHRRISLALTLALFSNQEKNILIFNVICCIKGLSLILVIIIIVIENSDDVPHSKKKRKGMNINI